MLMPIHPGRVLRRELVARGLSADGLALALGVPPGRVTEILNAQRAISSDTALRLGRYFGNSARFWANRQVAYDLAVAEHDIGERIAAEVRVPPAA